MSRYTIGKLARAAKVPIDTIRFYEKCGLLQPSRRPSGFREYSHEDLQHLIFIRRARGLGFSIEAIGQLLRLEGTADPVCIQSTVEDHLTLVDQKISELKNWRGALLKWRDGAVKEGHLPSMVETIQALTSKSANECVDGCSCSNSIAC